MKYNFDYNGFQRKPKKISTVESVTVTKSEQN